MEAEERISVDDLTADEAFDLALDNIRDATDVLAKVKPVDKNHIAMIEYLEQALTLLDYYLEQQDSEIEELDFNTQIHCERMN